MYSTDQWKHIKNESAWVYKDNIHQVVRNKDNKKWYSNHLLLQKEEYNNANEAMDATEEALAYTPEY